MAQTTRERYVAPLHSSDSSRSSRDTSDTTLPGQRFGCLSRYRQLVTSPPRLWTWATDDQVGDIAPPRTKLTSSTTTGSPPFGRHRDPTIHTPVRHVTNAQPDIWCTRWNRSIGRPDEVHVRPPSCLGLSQASPPTDLYCPSCLPASPRATVTHPET